jgi:cilia- and flagella-associated protein 57
VVQVTPRLIVSRVFVVQVCVSHGGKAVFTGTQHGGLRQHKLPLDNNSSTVASHCGSVTCLSISIDDAYIVSGAEDGVVAVFAIQDKDLGQVNRRARDPLAAPVVFLDEILVTKADIEGKITLISELKTTVEELKMANEYQLRLKDMNYNDKTSQLTERFNMEMESMRTHAQLISSQKDREEAQHDHEIAQLMDSYVTVSWFVVITIINVTTQQRETSKHDRSLLFSSLFRCDATVACARLCR